MSPPRHTDAKEFAANSGTGGRIRAARLARELTQEALAAAVGVTRSAVAQWETDRAGQVGANLARVAAALGVTAEHLLTGGPGPEAEVAAESSGELALLRLYRECTTEDRAFLLRTAVRLGRQAARERAERERDERHERDRVEREHTERAERAERTRAERKRR